MRKHKLRNWKTAAVLTVAVAAVAVWAATSLAASHAATVKVAIMTDCKGAFAFGYEQDIGGAQAAFAKWAHGKAVNKSKPSAGMNGINVNGTPIKIVGYGCGNDTVPLAVTETKRLMEKLGADVMIGPLSGDEAVYVANYAKAHPTKTFINGTAGSQDPTMQIAPKNQFRYHGDGAQWNAGIGEIAYKLNGWRKAAIIEDDYSFGWTSAAGMIADFCAVGGQIVKRVFPPLNTTDYAPFVRQLPPPNQVDGYFSTVGGTGTSAMLKAYEQAYGKINPKQWIGNLFFTFLGADKTVGPKVIGSYVGGFGTGAGLKTPAANAYRAVIHAANPSQDERGQRFRLQLLQRRVGTRAGAPEVQGRPRGEAGRTRCRGRSGPGSRSPTAVSCTSTRAARGSRTSTRSGWSGSPTGRPLLTVVAFVPNVDQSFGGLFTPSSPPPGRTQPPCKKVKTPWQGKIRVVKNGRITSQYIK